MAKFVVLNSMLKSILNYSGKWINTRQHSDVQVFTHWHSKIALPPLLQGQCRPFTSSPVPPSPLAANAAISTTSNASAPTASTI